MIGPSDEVRTALVETDERGQAVRLPDDFRFEGDRVRIRREGDRVILEPEAPALGYVHPDWPPGFWERLAELGPVSDEFVTAVEEARLGPGAWRPDPFEEEEERHRSQTPPESP